MLKLEALDTLFFRDGRPFSKDGDNWVSSLFPPSPSVFYGALRTAYFSENISQFNKANQDNDPTLKLKLKGVFIQVEDVVYFPLPLDLVKEKDNDEDVFSLSLYKNRLISNCPTEMILKSSNKLKVENVEGGLLDDLSFKDYLSGNFSKLPYRELSEFITFEPKIGIGIDRTTGVAKEHLLYRTGMIRPETSIRKKNKKLITSRLNILVDYEGLSLPSRGLMKVGGEGKVMAFEHCEAKKLLPTEIDSSQIKGNRFKVYLATPAKFEKGWLPRWIDEKTLTGEYEGIKLKLLTAAIGRYISIGGFDMKEKQPKPMVRAVPAGSVYYFEIVDDSNLIKVMNKFHYKNISDFDKEQGFGLAFTGGIL